MNKQAIDLSDSGLKQTCSVSQKNRNYLRNVKEALMSSVNSLNKNSKTQKASGWLYKLKIKHQILLLTTLLIILVAIMLFIGNQIYLTMFGSLMAEGFNTILRQQNANFQASIMVKYMLITRSYFYNDQQLLKSINRIYNYALQSEYQIDLQVDCSRLNDVEAYSSFSKYDQFCYITLDEDDSQTFENGSLSLEFIKFTSLLNQFVLCFEVLQSLQMNNILQINLDGQEQMVTYYTQNSPYLQYVPSLLRVENSEYSLDDNYNKETLSISNYYYDLLNQEQRLYKSKITQNLQYGSQVQGIIMVSISFNVFYELLQKFPDVNLGLVALDGTLLFEQRQYNYLDWVNLSSHEDYTKQLVINNTLFQEPIHVNIKKFDQLPYYFIVYNNLTYENEIKTIQAQILNKIMIQNNTGLVLNFILLLIILVICYLVIEIILKPLLMIHRLINFDDYNLKYFQKLQQGRQSNNILYLMSLMIYLKYSQFQNLGFHKSLQCLMIEDIELPIKQNIKGEIVLIKYLRQNRYLIVDTYAIQCTDRVFKHDIELIDYSGYTYTML